MTSARSQLEAHASKRKTEAAKRKAEIEADPKLKEYDQAVGRLAASMATLDAEGLAKLAALMPDPNPQPDSIPKKPEYTGRALDPLPGVLYGEHLRATSGVCQRCSGKGLREVDHCHKHLVVRGLICRECNSISERNIGKTWRRNCLWCAWDIWLEKKLALLATASRQAGPPRFGHRTVRMPAPTGRPRPCRTMPLPEAATCAAYMFAGMRSICQQA